MSDKHTAKWNDVCNRTDSCALCGAAAWAAGIENSQILVNGPLWCYFYAMRQLECGDVHLSERMHMTQLDNTAIIYGSEKCISEGVERVLANGKPDLLFVENNCSAGLIGDDLIGIIREMDLKIPCVAMDSGGTIGGFAEGFSRAMLKTFEQLDVEAFAKNKTTKSLRVNLLGVTKFYYNGEADLSELVRILTLAGYEVNTLASVEEILEVGQAELNIVCHEELGLEAAIYLEKHLGMKYICPGLPYGCYGTKKWLEKINAILPCPNLAEVSKEIKKMELFLTKRNSDFATLWQTLAYDRIIISGPGTTVQCMADALREEWVDTDKLIVVSQHRLKKEYCNLQDVLLYAEDEDTNIQNLCAMKPEENLLLLASSNEYMEMRLAKSNNISRCHIALPAVDSILLNKLPFMGIKGSANMLQNLWNAFVELKLKQ